jgi:hypothetical protein
MRCTATRFPIAVGARATLLVAPSGRAALSRHRPRSRAGQTDAVGLRGIPSRPPEGRSLQLFSWSLAKGAGMALFRRRLVRKAGVGATLHNHSFADAVRSHVTQQTESQIAAASCTTKRWSSVHLTAAIARKKSLSMRRLSRVANVSHPAGTLISRKLPADRDRRPSQHKIHTGSCQAMETK